MNSSFSTQLQMLQLALDSTSLSAFKECPRKYYYSIILGYAPRGQQVDLEFGILYHAATERYDHFRAAGEGHEQALKGTIKWALIATWDKSAKRGWITDSPNKNRHTLIRTLVWYLDLHKDDSFKTHILSNSKPAVELSFRYDTGYIASTGESFLHCGHLDRLASLNDDVYILDKKTTKHTLGPDYFNQFTPNNQFSGYAFAGKVAFGVETRGIVVDAVQVAVGFSRFERRMINRSPEMLEEWYVDLGKTLRRIDECAREDYWPMNDTACFRCKFRQICSKDPSVRENWLKSDYDKREWNPLQARGDV